MIVTRQFMDQVWTDLNSPTKEELDSLILSQNVDPIVAKDLLSPTPRQYATPFDKSIYVVIHIPFFTHAHPGSSEQEIDFIITEKGLVTARYESIDALHYFGKQVEVSEILNRENGSHLFFGLMKEVYGSLLNEVEYIEDSLTEIEKNTFNGYEKEMVWGISSTARNILILKRVVGAHEEVWQTLIEAGGQNFGEKFKKDAISLLKEWRRLMVSISNIYDTLNQIRETNNSILTTKQNEVMQIFTILAFVTFPLSLVAAIFGMNTAFTPIIGAPGDFWIVVSIMVMMSLAMFAYFKYKKWI